MKAHELTVKAMQQAQDIGPYNAISRALTEYGEHVRSEAVKVCIDKAEWNKGLGYHGHMERVANDCAAAIEKMELP